MMMTMITIIAMMTIIAISVEGNVGAGSHFIPIVIMMIQIITMMTVMTVTMILMMTGKSTLLNFFNQFPEFAVHKEPLDQWQVDYIMGMIS